MYAIYFDNFNDYNYKIDVKNWKIKTNFDVRETLTDFKKSIICPDLQSCKIESNEDVYLDFSKNNDTIYHNKNTSTKHIIHTNSYANKTIKPIGNIQQS